MPFFVFLLFFLFCLFFFICFFSCFSPTSNHHKLSLLWIGSGKPINQSGCLSSPETFWLACLFSVCSLQLMHIPLLTFNLPCKVDYLLVCDLWAAVTYRLYVLLKYYNGQMSEMGKQSWERNHDSGECWKRGEMKGWKGEEWRYPLLKRVVRRALLEALSRLNGATEGSIESNTPLLLALLFILISFHLILLISHPPCLPPHPSLPPFLHLHSSHGR